MKEVDEEVLCEILINTTDEMALRELFEARIEVWDRWTSDGSRKTGALEDMIRRLDGRHALDYVPYALKLTLEQVEKDKFITALALLSNLIMQSHTRGIVDAVLAKKEDIDQRVRVYEDRDGRLLWHNIKSWYGLS